jgi:hypothetical protein
VIVGKSDCRDSDFGYVRASSLYTLPLVDFW